MKSLWTSASTALTISASPPQRPSGVDLLDGEDLFIRGAWRSDDRPGCNRVHQDIVGCQFQRQRFGQRNDAALRDVVRQEALVSRPAAPRDPVAEVDDAPAALGAHVRHGGVGAKKRGAKVDVHHRVPVRDREIVEGSLHVDGRHVDEHVEPAERVNSGLHRGGTGRGIGEIGGDCDRASPGLLHEGGALLGLGLRSRVGERDVSPLARELRRHGETDPLAASDERRLAGKLHGIVDW